MLCSRLMFCAVLAAPLGLTATVSTGHAADNSACMLAWKSADANANGTIDVGEDASGALLKSLPAQSSRKSAAGMTRDQFLSECTAQAVNETTPTPRPNSGGTSAKPNDFPIDYGKGDMTPGKNKLSEADAKKRIEALGFKDVQDLKLDSNGIWRGTALAAATGNRQNVALDAQGDVISK